MLNSLKKIFENNNTKDVETSSIQGRKPSQEDDYFVSDVKFGRRLCFVADGVGGHGHGDFASAKTVEVFREAFNNMSENDIVEDFLKNTALSAARQVLAKCIEDPSYKNCGSTLSGFLVTNHSYYTINIGDSRVYLWNRDCLSRETHDHSIVQQMIDNGELTEAEAFTHPRRNIMTSAIGQELSLMKIDVNGPRPIEHGDILMAFSDGVHDALTDELIFRLVKRYEKTDGLAEALTTSAFNSGGKDNITAVIYRFLE
ncbi:MAG: protein phosphatase 2C domain-containing protein [Bacteroidales bacterium]|nr:protein phosphatase 2C domain-containing protein [Bacteroidales bacterium]